MACGRRSQAVARLQSVCGRWRWPPAVSNGAKRRSPARVAVPVVGNHRPSCLRPAVDGVLLAAVAGRRRQSCPACPKGLACEAGRLADIMLYFRNG